MNYYDDYRINKVLDNCYNHITDGDYKGTCDAFLKGVRDIWGAPQIEVPAWSLWCGCFD